MEKLFLVMLDSKNRDFRIEKPDWTRVGVWQWWGWNALYPDFRVVDEYLNKTIDKPVALSIMLFLAPGVDLTPPEVYAKLGITGWTIQPTGQPAIKCPAWGNKEWENEYFAFVTKFAAKYDNDPRVHSIWICTGFDGETVTDKNGYYIGGQYFREFVKKTIPFYANAFVNKPVFLLGTGTEDRILYSQLCASLNVGFKENALAPDLPNHVFPRNHGGLLDVIEPIMDRVYIGFEHFYAANPEQSYWSMLTALAYGADIIDLDEPRLDILAATKILTGESVMQFTYRLMNNPYALWVARDTQYPGTPTSWECGKSGPWEYGITATGIKCGARDSLLWKSAPEAIRKGLYGAYGIGRLEGVASLQTSAIGEAFKITAIVCGDFDLSCGSATAHISCANWDKVTLECPYDETIVLDGTGWVHMVLVEPSSVVPPPPEDDLEKRVELLEIQVDDLATDILVINQKLAKIGAILSV